MIKYTHLAIKGLARKLFTVDVESTIHQKLQAWNDNETDNQEGILCVQDLNRKKKVKEQSQRHSQSTDLL